MRRLLGFLDPFVVLLVATVAVAAVLPATGRAAEVADGLSVGAIALLFFLYGARLSTAEVSAGVRHWRLHVAILACTFVLFPLLGLAAGALEPRLLTPELAAGVLFLCLVPSTVQSSIAFTSMARGNVPAAIAAGSFSSLLGMAATPLLAGALIGQSAGFSTDALVRIAGQLLLPFVLGQLLRRWIGGFVVRNRTLLAVVERGSVLLVVYAAFSRGVVDGIWGRLTWAELGAVAAVTVALLGIMLLVTGYGSRALGFPRADRVAIVFAGSNKSLAVGLPMSSVLFGAEAAMAVLPLMLYHQVQLIVCAVLARRWNRRVPPDAPGQDAGSSPSR